MEKSALLPPPKENQNIILEINLGKGWEIVIQLHIRIALRRTIEVTYLLFSSEGEENKQSN